MKNFRIFFFFFFILDLEEGHDTCGTNVFFLLWSYIAPIYYEDLGSGLQSESKLTSDHINFCVYNILFCNKDKRCCTGSP